MRTEYAGSLDAVVFWCLLAVAHSTVPPCALLCPASQLSLFDRMTNSDCKPLWFLKSNSSLKTPVLWHLGHYGATIALHANHDPSVFGGPSADQQYVPRRQSAAASEEQESNCTAGPVDSGVQLFGLSEYFWCFGPSLNFTKQMTLPRLSDQFSHSSFRNVRRTSAESDRVWRRALCPRLWPSFLDVKMRIECWHLLENWEKFENATWFEQKSMLHKSTRPFRPFVFFLGVLVTEMLSVSEFSCMRLQWLILQLRSKCNRLRCCATLLPWHLHAAAWLCSKELCQLRVRKVILNMAGCAVAGHG